jgi:hypothetical protein
MNFQEYEARLQAECDQIQLEPGCSVTGPFVNFTEHPDLPPWTFELYIFFSDGAYVRIWEMFGRIAGNRTQGQRLQSSYHYGPVPARCDSQGLPLWSSSDPRVIRIDRDDWHGPHMHYGGEDHIPQNRVDNMVIEDMTLTVFLTAVLEHRASQRPLNEILRFRIR